MAEPPAMTLFIDGAMWAVRMVGLWNMISTQRTASNQSVFIGDGRIRGFDGLRALAFLLVFASHKIYFAHADSFGDAGVWLFFVLSGFLIIRILARCRSEIEGGMTTVQRSLGRFYLRRTARIFPPYYLLLAFLAATAVFVHVGYFATSEKRAYLLYGTNFLVASRGEWVGDFGHFWTLAIEEQFYLLFAPLALLVPRRHTINLCLAIILAGLTTKVGLEVTKASAVSIDVNSLSNFALLGFGGVIGLKASRPAPNWLIGGTGQVAVLCLYLTLPVAFGTWPKVWPLLGKLSAVLVGVLLFQIFRGQQSWFVAVLERAPLRKIGRISYGAYLIHPFLHFSVIEDLLWYFGRGITPPRPVQVLVELVASLVIAAVSWRYLERQIIAWAARVTSGPASSDTHRRPTQLTRSVGAAEPRTELLVSRRRKEWPRPAYIKTFLNGRRAAQFLKRFEA